MKKKIITDIAVRNGAIAVATGGKAFKLSEHGDRAGDKLVIVIRPGRQPAWFAVSLESGIRRSRYLGEFPSLSVGQARMLARRPAITGDVAANDSSTEPVCLTVKALAEAYIGNLRKEGKVSADRIAWYFLGGGGIVEALGANKLAADVAPDDLLAYLSRVAARGAFTLAYDLRAYLHAMFEYAITARFSYETVGGGIDWGVRINPVASVPKGKFGKNARERYLEPHEVKAFWDWCTKQEWNKRYRVVLALKLTLATGQRPMEIAQITTRSYCASDQSLKWATTKNGKPHWIPLPRQADDILRGLRANEHGLFFWRREYPDQRVDTNQMSAAVRRYIKETGAEAFEMRDLRRTWKTLAGGAGLSPDIRSRIQNHSIPGVASTHYDRYSYEDEKRIAMNWWAEELAHILITGERRPRILPIFNPSVEQLPAPEDADKGE